VKHRNSFTLSVEGYVKDRDECMKEGRKEVRMEGEEEEGRRRGRKEES
jgi:hypothetical protein